MNDSTAGEKMAQSGGQQILRKMGRQFLIHPMGVDANEQVRRSRFIDFGALDVIGCLRQHHGYQYHL